LDLLESHPAAAVKDAEYVAGYHETHSRKRYYSLFFAKDNPTDRDRINEAGIINDGNSGHPLALESVCQKHLADLRKNANQEKKQPIPSLRRLPLKKQTEKANDRSDKLEMEHHGQRMFLSAKTADKIISHSGTGCRKNHECKIKR